MLARLDPLAAGDTELALVRAIAAMSFPPEKKHESVAAFAEALRVMAMTNASSTGKAVLYVREVARHLPIVVFGIDERGLLTECFGGGLERLGLRDDDLTGVAAGAFGDAIAEWPSGVSVGEKATKIIEGDGANGPFVFHAVAATLGGAQVFLGVAVDVTSRHEIDRDASWEILAPSTAVAVANRREARFETVSEHVPIGVFLADAGGVLTYANPELLRILERDWNSLREMQSLHAVIHPDDLAAAAVALDTGDRSAESRIFEGRIVRAGGAAVSVRIRMVTLYDDDGESR